MPTHIINTGNQTVSGNFTAIGNLSATGIVYGDGSGLTNISGGGGSSSYSTKNISFFTPLDNIPPETLFATLDTRNTIPVLNFDQTLNESAVFQGILPTDSNLLSGLRVNLEWVTIATSGDVVWSVQFENHTHDLDSDSYDISLSGVSAAQGTSGILSTISLNCTAVDSLSQGDSFRFKVTRSGAAALDTLTDNAQLMYVHLTTVA